MAEIKINVELCKGCGLCVAQCPIANIKMSEEANNQGHIYPIIISKEKCTGCALCCKMCPDVAIEIEK